MRVLKYSFISFTYHVHNIHNFRHNKLSKQQEDLPVNKWWTWPGGKKCFVQIIFKYSVNFENMHNMQTQILNVWQWTWPAGRLAVPCIRQPPGLGLHYSSTFVLEESEILKSNVKKKYLRKKFDCAQNIQPNWFKVVMLPLVECFLSLCLFNESGLANVPSQSWHCIFSALLHCFPVVLPFFNFGVKSAVGLFCFPPSLPPKSNNWSICFCNSSRVSAIGISPSIVPWKFFSWS